MMSYLALCNLDCYNKVFKHIEMKYSDILGSLCSPGILFNELIHILNKHDSQAGVAELYTI